MKALRAMAVGASITGNVLTVEVPAGTKGSCMACADNPRMCALMAGLRRVVEQSGRLKG